MKPFDLEAAKRGEPIVCRDGTPAKFIAHVPEAREVHRVIALRKGEIMMVFENGAYNRNGPEDQDDLFMAPKKRTVWLNLYSNEAARMHPTQRAADASGKNNRIGGKAWPLEIEE